MVAPVAGVATPLFGPAELAPVVPLRCTIPSDSSGIVPNTSIKRLLKIDNKRKPAKIVFEDLSVLSRLFWFHAAATA